MKVHDVVPVWVLANVDAGIADMVRYLQTIPGVRTHASCQGTIGEGGPHPYRPQVLVTWTDDAVRERLTAEFDFSPDFMEERAASGHWGYIHPRDGWVPPAAQDASEIVFDRNEDGWY